MGYSKRLALGRSTSTIRRRVASGGDEYRAKTAEPGDPPPSLPSLDSVIWLAECVGEHLPMRPFPAFSVRRSKDPGPPGQECLSATLKPDRLPWSSCPERGPNDH